MSFKLKVQASICGLLLELLLYNGKFNSSFISDDFSVFCESLQSYFVLLQDNHCMNIDLLRNQVTNNKAILKRLSRLHKLKIPKVTTSFYFS